VVETGGLENRFTRKGNGGSNPSPSARSSSITMTRSGVSLDAVWQMGAPFHGVEKSTTFGSPALKVKGPGGKLQVMACVPTNKAAEPGSLLIRVDRRARATLLEEAPEIYYAPDHYLGYDGVLVRLAQLTPELLHDLLATAHNFVTRKRSGR
jgi:hypothetical protein